MGQGVVFLLFVAVFAAPTLLALLVRSDRSAALLYVYLGIVLTLGGVLGQVFALTFAAPVVGDVVISGGTVLYGAFMSTAVMLAVVTRDAPSVRRVAYLVLLENTVIGLTYVLAGRALRTPGVINPFDVDPGVFDFSVRLLLTGGALIIVELYAIVVLLEWVKRRDLRLPLEVVALVGFVAVVLLDGVLFWTLSVPFAPDLVDLITGGVRSKVVVALAYAVPLAVYLLVSRDRVRAFRVTPLDLQLLVVAPRDRLLHRLEQQTEETARLRQQVGRLTTSVSDGVVTTDATGIATGANEAAARLLGVHGAGIVGRDVRDLLGAAAVPDDPEGDASTVVRLEPGAVVEARVLGATDGRLVLLHDVTEQVRHEQALAEAQAAEHRAREHAAELDRAKAALVQAASHEFRTPVAVVAAAVDTLVARDDELGEADRRAVVAALDRSVQRLRLLLDDLTDVDRLGSDAATPTVDHVDVGAVVRRTVASSPVAERCEVTVDGPVELATVPAHVVRIVEHLLSNVQKYAPDGGVRIHVAARPGGAVVEVHDEGPGLPEDVHERAFEPFFRIDDDHPRPGTGVGLSLVRQLAELLDGSARIVPTIVGLHVVVELGDMRSAPSPAAV